ncbi:MAG: pantoate--beta-alanine ligase [Cyclobacteriaceae bacterium]|nr:pantoate--beta-alanine ligase [Cyclobacteriaceae bacterium]
MQIFKEISPLRAYLNTRRQPPNSVGFVPTMGALHEGHLSLIRAAQKENTLTVCSIYVNPTQFGNPEDLIKYPRTLDNDLALLESLKCDVVFCPETDEMYGSAAPIAIAFPGLDDVLEGEFRPGHFSGVAQVVAKLFHIVEPDRAYFGQKDFQQVMVVTRLVEALKFNVTIVPLPIVREADGLAMSSRNQRLSSVERKKATVIYDSLRYTRKKLLEGQGMADVIEDVRRRCAENQVRLEYLALADRKTLTLLDRVKDPRNAVILIAAQVGPVRLIDNLVLET